MAEARQRYAWAHTSSLLALIANTNRDPKKHRPFKPSDFDPFARRRQGGTIITKDNVMLLKRAFLGEPS